MVFNKEDAVFIKSLYLSKGCCCSHKLTREFLDKGWKRIEVWNLDKLFLLFCMYFMTFDRYLLDR